MEADMVILFFRFSNASSNRFIFLHFPNSAGLTDIYTTLFHAASWLLKRCRYFWILAWLLTQSFRMSWKTHWPKGLAPDRCLDLHLLYGLSRNSRMSPTLSLGTGFLQALFLFALYTHLRLLSPLRYNSQIGRRFLFINLIIYLSILNSVYFLTHCQKSLNQCRRNFLLQGQVLVICICKPSIEVR